MTSSRKNKKQNSQTVLRVDSSSNQEIPAKIVKRAALSGWPMILGWLAMLIFAFHTSTHMVAAGDTWVAMACGRHFINHGVDTVEPFSANSHKAGPTEEDIKTWPGWAQWIAGKVGMRAVRYWHPTGWINQNWLTHVIFYWLTHLSPFADAETFSFNTLVYWKFTIYILTVICVYYTGRVLGVNPALSAVFACFAMFIGRSFHDIRPAGFSNLLVAIFILILVLTTYRNILYIWLVVPLVVFWCNVHGGYIYAFIVLVPFVALHLLTSVSKKSFVSIGLKGVYHTVAAGVVAFLAMVIFNPFHLTNLTHTFIISVSKHAERWRTVNEWHPAFEWSNPVGTGFPFLVLFILNIGLLILWLLSRSLKPKFLKAPKNELDAQRKLFVFFSKVLGCAAAVLVCWTAFISFSLLGLDAASFFFCAIFVAIVLLSIYRSIHFIYLVIPLTLLALWSANPRAGYGGRYIYPFLTLPIYVILHIFASLLSGTIKIKTKNIALAAATAVATLILMAVIFNPFKFEMPVWHVEQFLHLRRMWRPRYERNVEVSYTHLFSVLYITNIISVIVAVLLAHSRRILNLLPNGAKERSAADTYELPKIDLAVVAIAALTIYMAYRSRRFIPIAAFTACPVVAMFIDQIIRTISAARNFHKRNCFVVSPMPRNLQAFFTLAAMVAVLAFGLGWGLKFKRVYLDPWPTDTKLNSVFIRMTASDAKPFWACKFIKMNKLEGKMFNYWTEGGFIAWGQEPDPNTGKTPLQLFMDGRAQAAYDPKAYGVWANIMSGGRITAQILQSADARKRRLTAEDYTKIGRWVDEQLKDHKVWVVLMPEQTYSEPRPREYYRKTSYHTIRGLERHPDWSLVFYNDRQKLFVDVTTSKGRELYEGIFNGKTLYPDGYDDGFSRNFILAHYLLLPGREEAVHKQGLDFAKKAFEVNPSHTSIQQVIYATRFIELRPLVYDYCKKYFDRFAEMKDDWARQDGYHRKVGAALSIANYLRSIAKSQKNTELVDSYDATMKQYRSELRRLIEGKRW